MLPSHNKIQSPGDSLIVFLDDERFGAGPGVVIGYASDRDDFIAQVADRDGCWDARYRMWGGVARAGDRVQMKAFTLSGPVPNQDDDPDTFLDSVCKCGCQDIYNSSDNQSCSSCHHKWTPRGADYRFDWWNTPCPKCGDNDE